MQNMSGADMVMLSCGPLGHRAIAMTFFGPFPASGQAAP